MKADLSRAWRPMTEEDLPAVLDIADRVHVDYPEDEAVVVERFRLYPAGCAVLDFEQNIAGYTLTHPWHYGAPPTLNTTLGALPERPTTYYIHDLALLPETRGTGVGAALAHAIVSHAREAGYDNASLVAVNSSVPFWRKIGFEVMDDPALAAKLKTYGGDARFMAHKIAT